MVQCNVQPTLLNMDSPETKKSHPLVASLSVFLIIVAAIAAWYAYKWNQSQEVVASLTSQLESSEKQIAELQPLAEKARQLPIVVRIDRHAINAGYNLFTFNRSRDSLRFHFTVNGGRQFNAVIDGGKFWVLKGLANGDTVQIDSDGYDAKTVSIN